MDERKADAAGLTQEGGPDERDELEHAARLTQIGGAGPGGGTPGEREPGSDTPMEEPEAAGLVQDDGPDKDRECKQATEIAH